MIFSSLPVYLDAPNWQQQLLQENFGTDHNLDRLLPPLHPNDHHHVAGGVPGSFRPSTMADRARQAKIPLPEAGLKCPRCESSNTKFCYYNNYSLSQPRHFCKACRRYWTRGGALRNVPVGGGCRRNKNNKKNCSKPPAVNDIQTISNSNGTDQNIASGSFNSELICQLPQSDLIASLQHINGRHGVGHVALNSGAEIQTQTDPLRFHMGNTSSGNISSKDLCVGGVDHQWRLQQFPWLTSAFEPPSSVASYPFQTGCVETTPALASTGDGPLGILSSSSHINRVITDQLTPVKFEDNRALNLPRSSTQAVSGNNNQYWGGGNSATWTEISALTSSSTSHLL